ncbi:MAG: HEAT repeat domain-containing protein [Planctomycetia bacterium]|nr:HEAT repeat domain-containing protein [Planctomycetia bacterium]
MPRISIIILLMCCAGCGPTLPEEFTVSGKPLDHWLTAIKSEDVGLREKAIAALGNVGTLDPQVVPALAEALHDAAPSVRSKAALALLKIGPDADEAIDALTSVAHNDADPEVRLYAAKALAKVCGKK